MSGAHRVWTPEQRAAQRARLAARRASMEAKRVAALRTDAHRTYAAERQRANRRNPDYNARHAAAQARPEVKAQRAVVLAAMNRRPEFRAAKVAGIRRGAAQRALAQRTIPAGYDETYRYLVAALALDHRQALAVVQQQHAWDVAGARPFDLKVA